MAVLKNKVIGRVMLLLLVIGAFVLLAFGMRSKDSKTCKKVEILVGTDAQRGFVDQKDVEQVIRASVGRKPEGVRISRFDLRKLELALQKNVWIKQAQMFFDNNEVLHVKVEQRLPVARIVDISGASYYIDSTGFQLPLSNSDRADVPVFTGATDKLFAKQDKSKQQLSAIRQIAAAINADEFWLADAAQIDLSVPDHIELYPAVGQHVVDMGDGNDAAAKLYRLKVFYKEVMSKKGFNAYPRLSVAYKGQVVASKRDSAATLIDKHKAVEMFEKLVANNRSSADIDAVQEQEQKALQASGNHKTAKPSEAAPANNTDPSKNNTHESAPANTPKAVMPQVSKAKNNND